MTLSYRYAVSACHVPGCQSGLRARYTIRTKPTRQRPAPETAMVCADCWLDAAKDPRLDAVGDGPGEYVKALRAVPPADGPAKRRRGDGYTPLPKKVTAKPADVSRVVPVLRDHLMPISTTTVAELTGLDRRKTYSALRWLEENGQAQKHETRGASNVVRWSWRAPEVSRSATVMRLKRTGRRLGRLQCRCLAILDHAPATANEIAAITEVKVDPIRRTLTRLQALNVIEVIGDRRSPDAGQPPRVWAIIS